jgi:hypothetical protein
MSASAYPLSEKQLTNIRFDCGNTLLKSLLAQLPEDHPAKTVSFNCTFVSDSTKHDKRGVCELSLMASSYDDEKNYAFFIGDSHTSFIGEGTNLSWPGADHLITDDEDLIKTFDSFGNKESSGYSKIRMVKKNTSENNLGFTNNNTYRKTSINLDIPAYEKCLTDRLIQFSADHAVKLDENYFPVEHVFYFN